MSDTPEASDDRPADLRALIRERIPPGALEDRTVAALRREGLLTAPGLRRPPRRLAPWAMAAAAAGVGLFAAGFAVGQADGTRRTVEVVEALRDADASRTAALIQRSGSDYVEALSALVQSRDDGDVGPGREVARGVIRSALTELTRLDPDDADLRRALLALDPGQGSPADTARTARAILWF